MAGSNKSSGDSTSKYTDHIEQHASLYGYKSANLLELERLAQEFLYSDVGQRLVGLYSSLKIEVPKFLPLEGNIIKEHLDKYDPNNPHQGNIPDDADKSKLLWRESFNQFVESFNK